MSLVSDVVGKIIPNSMSVSTTPLTNYNVLRIQSGMNELKKINPTILNANNQTLDMVTSWSNSTTDVNDMDTIEYFPICFIPPGSALRLSLSISSGANSPKSSCEALGGRPRVLESQF